MATAARNMETEFPPGVFPSPPARKRKLRSRTSASASPIKNGGFPITAFQDVNLEVKQGEFIALVGPSGCGKTTHPAHHRRPSAADRRHHLRARPIAAGNPPSEKVRHRLSKPRAVRLADGAAQRVHADGASWACRKNTAPPRSPKCLSSSGCTISARSIRTSCRAACSSASVSRAPGDQAGNPADG